MVAWIVLGRMSVRSLPVAEKFDRENVRSLRRKLALKALRK